MTSVSTTDWKLVTLSEVIDLVKDQINPQDKPEFEFNYLSIGNVQSNTGQLVDFSPTKGQEIKSTKLVFTTDDILYSRLRPNLNKVHIPEFNGICATDMLPLRPKSQINRDFLAFYLRTPSVVEYAVSRTRGIQLPRLSTKDLLKLPVPLPPKDVQLKIVSIVKGVSCRSRVTREELSRIPDLTWSLWKSFLSKVFHGNLIETSYDEPPIEISKIASSPRNTRKGKSRKRIIEVNVKYELPPNWRWIKFSELCVIQNGRAFPSSKYTTDGIRLLRPGNIGIKGWVFWTKENTRYLPEEFVEKYPHYLVNEGEIVINLTAQSLRDEFLGRVAMMGEGFSALLNQRIARLTPIPEINPSYLMFYMKTPEFRRFVNTLDSGTLIKHMYSWQLEEVWVPVAPVIIQNRIVNLLNETNQKISAIETTTSTSQETIVTLEQSILSRAFSGKLENRQTTLDDF